MWKKLQFRSAGPVLVRDEHRPFGLPLDVLYLADFHLTGRSAARAQALAAQVRQLRPHLVLLGGDYADTPGGLGPFAEFVLAVAAAAPVLAVAGNHDWLYRRRLPGLVHAAGGRWLAAGQAQSIALADGYSLHVAATGAAPVPPAAKLLRLLCAHQPPRFAQLHPHYEVALAGHLHGGQLVLWQRGDELYPGRWLYRHNGLRYQYGNSQLLVSRGVGDTLPFRYNCPHEIVRLRLAPA